MKRITRRVPTSRRALVLTGAFVAIGTLIATSLPGSTLAFAASHSPAASASNKPLAGMKIGIAMREEVNGSDEDVIAGAESQLIAAGASVTVTDGGGSQSTQVTQIRTLINSGVKGIIIGLGTASVLAPVVRDATAKGIVVTSADVATPIPGELGDSSGNEFLVGTLGASMLLSSIGYTGTVYALWVPGAPVLDARISALEGMAKNYSTLHIVPVPTTFSAAKVYSQVKAIMAAHSAPGAIAAIWVAYDQISMGAVEAVEGAHSHIPVFSEDGDIPGFKSLLQKDSPFQATVSNGPLLMGANAGREMIKGIEKDTAGIPPETLEPAYAITRNNLVAAATEQYGSDAWKLLGTTPAAVRKEYPQNEPLIIVYSTLVEKP
jgi:ABC-type sugar transport system substrate-binding protein